MFCVERGGRSMKDVENQGWWKILTLLSILATISGVTLASCFKNDNSSTEKVVKHDKFVENTTERTESSDIENESTASSLEILKSYFLSDMGKISEDGGSIINNEFHDGDPVF